jgi:hypothetical protein
MSVTKIAQDQGRGKRRERGAVRTHTRQMTLVSAKEEDAAAAAEAASSETRTSLSI